MLLAFHHWEKDVTSLLFQFWGVLPCRRGVFPDDDDLFFFNGMTDFLPPVFGGINLIIGHIYF